MDTVKFICRNVHNTYKRTENCYEITVIMKLCSSLQLHGLQLQRIGQLDSSINKIERPELI